MSASLNNLFKDYWQLDNKQRLAILIWYFFQNWRFKAFYSFYKEGRTIRAAFVTACWCERNYV